ncbi:hypothetical protein ScPMuIL_016084 [Solemya velum]
MRSHPNGRVEGIVWHCKDGQLYKVHRNHVGLPWPVKGTLLSQRRVHVNIDLCGHSTGDGNSQLVRMSKLNGKTYDSITQLHNYMISS